MSIEYLQDGSKFSLSYLELKRAYNIYINMPDEEFIENLVDIAHFACVVCFLKEIPAQYCINDIGIIHELIHLMSKGGTTTSLKDIRALFKEQLKLS